MFAIYNNGTVGFRSTSDNLYALKNVEELESARFEPKEGLIQNFSNELNAPADLFGQSAGVIRTVLK